MIFAAFFCAWLLAGRESMRYNEIKILCKRKAGESDLIKEDMQFDPAALCRKELYYGDDSGTD